MSTLLVYLLVFCVVAAVAYYVITSLLPEPIQKIALCIALVVGVIWLVGVLLPMAGIPLRLGSLK